ncbi:MAG: hypothetical protein ACI9OJ_001366, partial [Myxococcota bacterium]
MQPSAFATPTRPLILVCLAGLVLCGCPTDSDSGESQPTVTAGDVAPATDVSDVGSRAETVHGETVHGETADGDAADGRVELPDTSPTVTLSIEPTVPSTTDDLVATVSGAQPSSIVWLVDESPADFSGPSVAASKTKRGQVWAALTAGQRAEVTIVNTAPACQFAGVVPGPRSFDPQLCTCEGRTDPDGDPPEDTCTWMIAGSPAETDGSCLLPGGLASPGDDVICSITAADDADMGEPVSGSVTVINTAPEAPNVVITPDSVTEETVATCAATPTVEPDGQPVTLEYLWWVNDVEVGTDSQLNGTAFDKTDVIRCEARAFDGAEYSDWEGTPITTVDNSIPTASGASVTPDEAPRSAAFDCIAEGLSDADPTDMPNALVQWFITPLGGIESETGNGSATLNALPLSVGDIVRCEVTPYDGENFGSMLMSGSAVVVNLLPTIESAAVSPSAPTVGDPVECVVGNATDPDGDAVTVSTIWLVNGTKAAPETAGPGDSLACIATPSDPFGSGAAVESSAVIIMTTLCPPGHCDDGIECSEDVCDPTTGDCGAIAQDCSDDDVCTADWCDVVTGSCQHAPVSNGICGENCAAPVECQDFNACTHDACQDGVCTNVLKDCDDGVLCTQDSCDSESAECGHTPIADCTNGCTLHSDCADDLPCSEDVCDTIFGTCSNTPIVDCQLCAGDAECVPPGGVNPCIEGQCDEGACAFSPRVCYDDVPCTFDTCDTDSGCEFRLLQGCETGCVEDGDCDDGSDCTVELCSDGECSNALVECDDDDPCTVDGCLPESQKCAHWPDPNCSDDGGACESNSDCAGIDACTSKTC